MQMTNKTLGQRIVTALRFDLQYEQKAIDGVRRPSVVHGESHVRSGSRVRACCGAESGERGVRRLRRPEVILGTFSVLLLIAVVLFAGHLLNSRAKRGFDNLFDRWVWHEPLDDWNL